MENKKNKKGFTLIELLAIIVILAIIAVITVPIILNVIDESKRGSVKNSVLGYEDSIRQYYGNMIITDPDFEFHGTYKVKNGVLSQNGVDYEINFTGEVPTSGELTYEEGVLKSGYLVYGEYKATINGENIEVTKEAVGKIENRDYAIGEPITVGGYEWNVINNTDTTVTLIMNTGEKGTGALPEDPKGNLKFNITEATNSEPSQKVAVMRHCTPISTTPSEGSKETNCTPVVTRSNYDFYTYSWEKSLIQEYLNEVFLPVLESNIKNELKEEYVHDESVVACPMYSGSLVTDATKYTCSGEKYKVRLITKEEIGRIQSFYQNQGIYMSTTSSETFWLLHATKLNLWTMNAETLNYNPEPATEGTPATSYYPAKSSYMKYYNNAYGTSIYAQNDYAIRPVITLIK